MKWDSLPASVRTVVEKFLKQNDLDLDTAPLAIDSWVTSVDWHRGQKSTQLFVRLVVTLKNSTTYLVSGVIKRHGKSWRCIPQTLTAGEVPPTVADAKVSEGPTTTVNDTWSHYE